MDTTNITPIGPPVVLVGILSLIVVGTLVWFGLQEGDERRSEAAFPCHKTSELALSSRP